MSSSKADRFSLHYPSAKISWCVPDFFLDWRGTLQLYALAAVQRTSTQGKLAHGPWKRKPIVYTRSTVLKNFPPRIKFKAGSLSCQAAIKDVYFHLTLQYTPASEYLSQTMFLNTTYVQPNV